MTDNRQSKIVNRKSPKMMYQHPDNMRQLAHDHHRATVEAAKWNREAPQFRKRWRFPRLKVEWEQTQPETLVFRIKFAN